MDRELLGDFVKAYPAQPATAYWRAIEIAALLRTPLPEGRGLDLGCGDGKLTKLILDRSGPRELVGIDMDSQETNIARELDLYTEVLTCNACVMPFEAESFDFVISNSVMEHIPDLPSVIAEVGRVLRKGGTLVTTVPTIGFRANLKGSVLPWIQRDKYLARLDSRLAHFHYLSTRDWADMLERNGMHLDHRFGYLDMRECRRWETLSRLTGGLLYAASFGRSQPIEIQRKLGLRILQANHALPGRLSSLVADFLGGRNWAPPVYWQRDIGLDDERAGCLVVTATRR